MKIKLNGIELVEQVINGHYILDEVVVVPNIQVEADYGNEQLIFDFKDDEESAIYDAIVDADVRTYGEEF